MGDELVLGGDGGSLGFDTGSSVPDVCKDKL